MFTTSATLPSGVKWTQSTRFSSTRSHLYSHTSWFLKRKWVIFHGGPRSSRTCPALIPGTTWPKNLGSSRCSSALSTPSEPITAA